MKKFPRVEGREDRSLCQTVGPLCGTRYYNECLQGGGQIEEGFRRASYNAKTVRKLIRNLFMDSAGPPASSIYVSGYYVVDTVCGWDASCSIGLSNEGNMEREREVKENKPTSHEYVILLRLRIKSHRTIKPPPSLADAISIFFLSSNEKKDSFCEGCFGKDSRLEKVPPLEIGRVCRVCSKVK